MAIKYLNAVIPDLIRNPVLLRYYKSLDPEYPTSRDRQVQDDNRDTVSFRDILFNCRINRIFFHNLSNV